MNQNVPRHSRRVRSRWLGVRHLLTLIVLTGVLAATGLAAMVWWQERPLRQATAYLDHGDPTSALSTIDAFLRNHPLHGGAMSLRARTLVAVGRPIQAIDLFERFGGSNPKEIHAWAQALLQLNRWRDALPLLEHVVKTGVDRADVLHELAACRAEVGDLIGAIAAATDFAQQPGFSTRGNLLLGTLHNKQGNLRQAVAAWGDVLKDAPDAEGLQVPASEFFLDFGRVLHASGHSGLAAENVERSLSLKPSADGFVVLGNARSILGDQQAAENSYKEALVIEPGMPAARVGLARLALASGESAGAKEWLSTLESPDKLTSEVAVLLQQATTGLGEVEASKQWREKADKLRLVEQARETAMQVLRDVPESNLAQVVRAYHFAESGHWQEAESILKPITASEENQPFIEELYHAVLRRSGLPSIDLLPLQQF